MRGAVACAHTHQRSSCQHHHLRSLPRAGNLRALGRLGVVYVSCQLRDRGFAASTAGVLVATPYSPCKQRNNTTHTQMPDPPNGVWGHCEHSRTGVPKHKEEIVSVRYWIWYIMRCLVSKKRKIRMSQSTLNPTPESPNPKP